MNLKVKIEDFNGYRLNNGRLAAIYYKRGRWRLYATLDFRIGSKKRAELISYICHFMKVKPNAVMIGSLPEFLTLEVDIQEQT